jgi:uncharacterized protein YcfJ
MEINMQNVLRFGLAATGLVLGTQAAAQVTFYEREDLRGRSFTATAEVENLQRQGFNDRATSVVVKGDRWELCEGSRFRGPCVVLQPGEYPSLAAMGLNDGVSSLRPLGRRDAPAPVPIAFGQIDFYENEGFQGRSFSAVQPVPDLRRSGFNDRASSLVVTGGRWEICPEQNFGGPCTVLRPGQYPSLRALGLNDRISSVRAVTRTDRDEDPRPGPRPTAPDRVSRIVFYENESFQGRSMTADGSVEDFRRSGFNDRASSAVVSGGRWEACQDIRYGGACVVLRPGQYPSLAAMGMNDRISSARAVDSGAPVDDRRYAPLPLVSRDYGRRDEERLYPADITSVRAVVEDSGERCWVEPQQVTSEVGGGPNVPGALLGAVIGGILGHQVGGGTGKDVATGVGVVAGAAIGGNSGRGDGSQQVVTTQNVQRCSRNPRQARAAYWDVTYNFRGQEHRLQMNRAPGRTVMVNEQGEPRH